MTITTTEPTPSDSRTMLEEQTYFAATRLVKSRLRHYIYEILSRGCPDVWNPLVLVNEALLKSADQEWGETLPLWGDYNQPTTKVALEHFLRQALKEAQDSTLDIVPDKDYERIRYLTLKYESQFSIDGFLPSRDEIRLVRSN